MAAFDIPLVPSRARYATLLEIPTRIWLADLSRELGRETTLADVPDERLDEIAALGFDFVWMMGVWSTGPAGRAVSRGQAAWRAGFEQVLPDLTEVDIVGSPYAVTGYTVHPDFGGDGALARLRERLARRGVGLYLDFVPNHTALDHPWVTQRPDFYITGTKADLARAPDNYVLRNTARGATVLAHGRDPNYPGWPDTLQLDYRSSRVRVAMAGELERIAGQCDGVRCDMAMLVLPEVFARTWNGAPLLGDGSRDPNWSFWPEAIGRVRVAHPGFRFLAEAYWDLEWNLQQQGFDHTYDKRLYDRLAKRDVGAVRGHLWADLEFQARCARFLENHDEPRTREVFSTAEQMGAAIVTYFTPGLRFFHDGQLTGRKLRASIHLSRRAPEERDRQLEAFYARLLAALRLPAVADGAWSLTDCRPAWEGNGSFDRFLAFHWERNAKETLATERVLAVVNFAPDWGQCFVPLRWPGLEGKTWRFADQLGDATYDRDGGDLALRGLYLDLPPWGHHVFRITPV